MGVRERGHKDHRHSGVTVVLFMESCGWAGSAEVRPRRGAGAVHFTAEVVPLPFVAGGEVSAFHFKAPYELKRPARILLVDGYYETRVALSKMLSLCGQAANVAQDAKQALDLATRHPLDLLISEVNLPGMSGIELMLELQKVQPIPGIATSAFNARDKENAALAAGFDRLLIKPIPITQLIRSINEVMKKHDRT